MDFVANSPVWLKGFWGFNPEKEGVLGFTKESDRERFISESDEKNRLVCIYGATSKETIADQKSRLLGVLEVECVPIDSHSKMSDESKERNKNQNLEQRWRFAMPVRRAWRTDRNIKISDAFKQSYKSNSGISIASYGKWLVPDEARWLLTQNIFTEISVFGEPTIEDNSESKIEQSLEKFLKPSRGIFGGFGQRTVTTEDRPTKLYLAHFPKSAELLAGEAIPNNSGLFKIGISGNLKERKDQINNSFPASSKIKWEIILESPFPDQASAGEAEAAFKDRSIDQAIGKSLGKEFFVLNTERAKILFCSLSRPKGLVIKSR